jgi:hypothetical protein
MIGHLRTMLGLVWLQKFHQSTCARFLRALAEPRPPAAAEEVVPHNAQRLGKFISHYASAKVFFPFTQDIPLQFQSLLP